MSVKKQIFLINSIHWVYALGYIVIFFLSFWYQNLEKPFFFLAGFTVIAWLPFRGCPLTLWENKLRDKIELERRKFFNLTAIPHRFCEKFFNIRLPGLTTIYLIILSVIIRILV